MFLFYLLLLFREFDLNKYAYCFKADFELLFNNTKTYYAGRDEHKEAVQLENLFNKSVAAVQNGEELTLALGYVR